jgi:hypothetical protein
MRAMYLYCALLVAATTGVFIGLHTLPRLRVAKEPEAQECNTVTHS